MTDWSEAASARPTVVVTRPADQAGVWVEALQAAGWPVLALPLIDIAPVGDPAQWMATIGDGSAWHALWFVSPEAVRVVRAAGLPAPAQPRYWAPGPGTAQALCDWGVAAERIDTPSAAAQQMDSEALWLVVGPRLCAGMRVLAVRGRSADGSTGRNWLVQRCAEAGARVQTVVVYQRQPPQWGVAQCERARHAAHDGSIWLFSSSEAVAHLRQLLPAQEWRQARAVVTHPRIGQAARAAGFGVVVHAHPTPASVLQALESLV